MQGGPNALDDLNLINKELEKSAQKLKQKIVSLSDDVVQQEKQKNKLQEDVQKKSTTNSLLSKTLEKEKNRTKLLLTQLKQVVESEEIDLEAKAKILKLIEENEEKEKKEEEEKK